MSAIVAHLYIVLARLGGLGLLAFGFLDSSFLVFPLGNDLLVIALASKKHALTPYYVLMATAGSVLGCLVLDLLSRKGGEKGLEKTLSEKRRRYVSKRVKKGAGWALAFASLMPPPFPFTALVAAASAFQYPRKKLLSVIAASRFGRFFAEGVLAILFGKSILHLARSRIIQDGIIGLIVLSIAASALSVYSWIRKSEGPERKRKPVSVKS